MNSNDNFSVKDIVIEIKNDLKKHIEQTDKRLDALENWRSWIVGGVAVLTVVIPFIIYKIL